MQRHFHSNACFGEAPMPTLSLKLPDVLKQQAAAKKRGMMPYAFMVQVIELAAMAAEYRARFVTEAEAARKAMLESGKGYDAGKVRAYIQGRISGKKSARPKAKSWRH